MRKSKEFTEHNLFPIFLFARNVMSLNVRPMEILVLSTFSNPLSWLHPWKKNTRLGLLKKEKKNRLTHYQYMILTWGGGGMFGGTGGINWPPSIGGGGGGIWPGGPSAPGGGGGGSWSGGPGIIGMPGIRGGNIPGGGKPGGIMPGGGIPRTRNKPWCKIVHELKIKCTHE